MSWRKAGKAALANFPATEMFIRKHIWSRMHQPELELQWLARRRRAKFDISLDIGAALGGYAFVLGRISRIVYAFEPGSVHYRLLRLATSGSNITVVPAAVGSESLRTELFTPGNNNASRHRATMSNRNPAAMEPDVVRQTVNQVALDIYLPPLIGEGIVDFVKVDVEGFELSVLTGAKTILMTHYPIILCEIEIRHNPQASEVFELLYSLGYHSFFLRNWSLIKVGPEQLEALQSNPPPLNAETSASSKRGDNPEYVNNFFFSHVNSRCQLGFGI